MIKLNEAHRSELTEFLEMNPTLRLFYIGDLLAYGFDDPMCKFYGIFRGGFLEVCIMVYRNSIHLTGNYLTEDEQQTFYKMFEDKGLQVVNTSHHFLQVLIDFPTSLKLDMCELSVYKDKNDVLIDDACVEVLTRDDVEEAVVLMNRMFGGNQSVPEFYETHDKGHALTYCVKVEGKIVSVATVTALSPSAGMIVGVATLKEYQRQGYAKRCVQVLCHDMMKQGRDMVLFYTDPNAGKMYHDIGFVDQEPYYMAQVLGTIETSQ